MCDNLLAATKSAFEFGYRCCEKGLNIQAALMKFDEVMGGSSGSTAHAHSDGGALGSAAPFTKDELFYIINR